MVRYLKLDEDFWDNPKVILAGQDGGTLYLEILALNNRAGRDGVLTAQESQPRIVGRRLMGNFDWDLPRVTAALEACLRAELTVVAADGRLAIDGWDDTWRTAVTGQERTRAWRDRKAAAPSPSQRGNGSVTPVTEAAGDVTLSPSRGDEPQRRQIPSIPFQKDGTDHPFARARTGETSPSAGQPDGMTSASPPRNGSDGVGGRWAATVDGLRLDHAIAAAGVFDRSSEKRRTIVRGLVKLGVTTEAFEGLLARARKQGDNPAALLAHWLTAEDPEVLRSALRDAGFGLAEGGGA